MKLTMKWIYTFALLGITIAWAVFTVYVVLGAMAYPSAMNVIEASGTSVLLGALIAWNGTAVKHWFGGEEKP